MATEKQNGTIGNVLKQLRESKKLSMSNVANALGVSLSAYQKYENNSRDVSTTLLNALADFYGVTTDYLLGREPAPDPLQNLDIEVDNVSDMKFIEAYEKLPECVKQIFIDTMLKLSQASTEKQKEEKLINIRFYENTVVSAGTGQLDDRNEYPSIKQVPETSVTKNADFCCYVSGDSMEPMYFDRDLIFVKSQPNIDIGEIGIFSISGEMYIKKLGSDELISLNPKYPNIKKSPDIVCQGKVLGKI